MADDFSTGDRRNVSSDALFYEADVRPGYPEIFEEFRPEVLSHHVVHGPTNPGEQFRSSVNPAKAARFLGWCPRIDLADGLRETLSISGIGRVLRS